MKWSKNNVSNDFDSRVGGKDFKAMFYEKISIDNVHEFSLHEIRQAYKQYLNVQNLSTNTIIVSSTAAFYLWKKGNKDLFWDTVTAADFENRAKE